LEHLESGFGETNKGAGVDLGQAEQLQNLAGLGGDLVDTLDTDDEGKLGLGRDVEGVVGLGLAGETDLVLLLGEVLLDVGFGTLEDDLSLVLVGLRLELFRQDEDVVKAASSAPKDG
jgi:hypothetical protein